jgi:hypothetical protein
MGGGKDSVQYSPMCVEGANDSDTKEGREGERRHNGKRGPTLYENEALRMKSELQDLKRHEEDRQSSCKDTRPRDQRHSLSWGGIRLLPTPSGDCDDASDGRGGNFTPRCVHGQSGLREICEPNRGGIVSEHGVDVFLERQDEDTSRSQGTENKGRTRNVSPMIQAGEEDPSTKKLPTHLLAEDFIIMKSVELMAQLLPPNEMVTFTSVLQARR